MRSAQFLSGSLIAAAAAFSAVDAGASAQVCCDGSKKVLGRTSYTPNSVSFPEGSVTLARLQEVAAAYGKVLGSSLKVTLAAPRSTNCVRDDGVSSICSVAKGPNEITIGLTTTYYTNGQACDGGACCNLLPCSAPRIREADIRIYGARKSGVSFNIDWLLPSAVTADRGYPIYASPVFSHELVHGLGLMHDPWIRGNPIRISNTWDSMSTMWPNYPFGGWFSDEAGGASRVGPMARTSGELAYLYPGPSFDSRVFAANAASVNDMNGSTLLSASGPNGADWQWYPRRGGGNLPFRDSRTVRFGDRVQFKACWGNLGPKAAGTQTFDFALSTDAMLDWWDVRVPNNGWSVTGVSPYSSQCEEFEVSVPAVPPGLYTIMFGVGGSDGIRVGNVNRWLIVMQ